jgi:secretion/DNA translocation related TadE-like protein
MRGTGLRGNRTNAMVGAPGGAERGSATVLTVGALLALVLVLGGVLVVAGTVRDVHRARAAADLSALAAVWAVARGGGVDCGAGASVARANAALLTGCAEQGDGSVVVSVVVERRWPVPWSRLPGVATARARAGVVDGASPGRHLVPP